MSEPECEHRCRQKNERIAELEAALAPFADVAATLETRLPDHDYVQCITVEMCRRALRALSPE